MSQVSLSPFVRAAEEWKGIEEHESHLSPHPSHSQHHVRQTSITAVNDLVRSGVMGEQEAAYIASLVFHPQGLTDREAGLLLSLPSSTVSARRNGINKKHPGLVFDSGVRRKNKNGGTAIVWRKLR